MKEAMSNSIHDKGFEQMFHQKGMDLQHLKGNILGWHKLKRQLSPPRETRPLKKRYGSENISPDIISGSLQGLKKTHSNKPILTTNIEEAVMKPQYAQEMPSLKKGEDYEMDDIIPINLSLSNVPIKYCDDRVYTDYVPKDLNKAEQPVDDTHRQEDDNFREKMRKPMNELMEIFGIKTKDECLQYYFVGMKLQLFGMRMTKTELLKTVDGKRASSQEYNSGNKK